MRTPSKSYIVCSTPRTGSTLLCSLLKATKCAGFPESYFRAQDLAARANEWNICRPDGSFDFNDYVQCVLERGRTSNGIFASRVMWGTMAELIAVLRDSGGAGSDLEILESTFGATKFVYLTRRDAVAQAVSRLRAEQTNVWHIRTTAELGPETGQAIRYDREALQGLVDESVAHNRAWNHWFETIGVEPLRLAYEDLDQDNSEV